jgi:hypothetical protein
LLRFWEVPYFGKRSIGAIGPISLAAINFSVAGALDITANVKEGFYFSVVVSDTCEPTFADTVIVAIEINVRISVGLVKSCKTTTLNNASL